MMQRTQSNPKSVRICAILCKNLPIMEAGA